MSTSNSELLPILFSRGQNEGVDPRVAQAGVLTQVQNVRWRKDGRPAKRYGVAQTSTFGLSADYLSDFVNTLTTWQGNPLLVAGGFAATQAGTAWSGAVGGFPPAFNIGLPSVGRWSPGRRDPITRNESQNLSNPSVGFANGYLLHAWDNGGQVFCRITQPNGAILASLTLVATGVSPRCVGVGQYIYVITKNGTTLNCTPFDTTTLTFSAPSTVGGLNSSASFFDASARAGEWLLVYQSAISQLTVARMSGAATPASLGSQPITTSIGPGACKVAVAAQPLASGGEVFVSWYEPATGTMKFTIYSPPLSGINLGPTVIEVDTNNADCPGIVADSPTTAQMLWGGYIAATQTSYLRECTLGIGGAGTVATHYGLRPASKPAYISGDSSLSFWCHTHNSDAAGTGTKWDDQRTFYLMTRIGNRLSRQMHTPNVVASVSTTTSHLADIIDTGAGYFTSVSNTLRFGNGAVEVFGIDTVSFYPIAYSQRQAARDFVTAGRATQFAGGVLTEFNGYCEESDFSNTPVIISITGSAGGSLTTSSTYLYVAVYEWIDLAGRRHRSSPSDPFTFLSSTNTKATLLVAPLISQARFGPSVLHVYRSLPGQSTFHRVTPNIGAPLAQSGAATISYVDSMSDANAAVNEFVYTDGGVLPNEPAPPCTFMCVNDGRVWVGGQLDRCRITSSKLLVDGEPTQFTDADQFNVFLPDDNTGLAAIDGTVVAFARDGIYLVTGDGPNDQGVGEFSPPRKLPSDQGCIDWRSIVETSIGIFFQSKRGIHLLPRGFNTPVFVGLDIQDTLRAFPVVMSATLVTSPANRVAGTLGETTVRYVLCANETNGATCTATFDLRTSGWSVDTSPDSAQFGPGGTWSDSFVLSKSTGITFPTFSLWQESPLVFDDNSLFVNSTFQTGNVRPFGLCGFGMFRRVAVVGEYRGNCQVLVTTSIDGRTADSFLFNVTAADAPDGVVYLDATPSVLEGSSISVGVQDGAIGGVATEGFVCHGVMLEYELIGKTKRLAVGRRA